ncbi:MAG TPA: hypothetical protein VM914_07465 [Pyrinomonadaceae bacterium]|jgi:hypothetical protein|nr:hypothetical protein [Pyrinomonadaceae bacterium]
MRIQERSRRRASLAAVLVLPLFLMSFAAKCDGNKGNSNPNGNQNGTQAEAFPVEADERLGVEIRKAISKNAGNVAGVSALDLHVFSVKGKVGITGTIASDAARAEVVRIARETEVEVGGKKYKALAVDESQLTVKPPTPSTSPAPSP